MTEKINITYETLFDILRLEKNTGELQQLSESFYDDIVSYLEGKKQILKKEESVFSEAEKEKTITQVKSTKKLLKELYEKRENKIIDLALNKSKTGSDIIDLSSLLPQERRLFDRLVKIFSENRESILTNLINGKQPTLKETLEDTSKEGIGEIEKKEGLDKEETKTVRFIHPVPKFLGRKLEAYGPFEADEITSLPKDIADILIRKGRAEEIRKQ